jgi:hypothetical protein
MELLVNIVTAGVQHQPAVCTVNGEKFAVSWTDEGSIKARIFGTNEKPLTEELVIKAATTNETSMLSSIGCLANIAAVRDSPTQTLPAHTKRRRLPSR